MRDEEEVLYEVGGFERAPPPFSKKGTSKYPFEVLQPGQTMKFFKDTASVRDAAKRYCKTTGVKLTIRDAGGGWTKVWRTE